VSAVKKIANPSFRKTPLSVPKPSMRPALPEILPTVGFRALAQRLSWVFLIAGLPLLLFGQSVVGQDTKTPESEKPNAPAPVAETAPKTKAETKSSPPSPKSGLALNSVAKVKLVLEAVGDGRDFWLLRQDPFAMRVGQKVYVIKHRRDTDELGLLTRGPQIVANVGVAAMAASDGRLWLVWDDLSVQSIRVVDGQIPGQKLYPPPISQRALPGDPADAKRLTVKHLAAGRSGVWALVRVHNAEALKAIDKPRPSKTKSNQDSAKQDSTADGPDAGAADSPGSQPNLDLSSNEPFVPVDRLLRLQGDKWVKLNLPANWPEDEPGQLIGTSVDSDYPMLVTMPGPIDAPKGDTPSGGGDIWVYEHRSSGAKPAGKTLPAATAQTPAPTPAPEKTGVEGNIIQHGPDTFGWSQTKYRSPFDSAQSAGGSGASASWIALSLQGQLLVGKGSATTGFELVVLRPDNIVPLGVLSAEKSEGEQELVWRLTSMDQVIALIYMDTVKANPQRGVKVATMNLQGAMIQKSLTLKEKDLQYFPSAWPFLVLVVALGFATVDLLIFWRREESRTRPTLPKDVVLADIGARALAGVIDLAPGFALAYLLFQKSVIEILTNWPGYTKPDGDMQSLLPGLVVVAVYVFHTFIGELRGGQSIGKKIMRLRVVDISGGPATSKQIIHRNLRKVIDTVAFPFLVLLLISPLRQRLGDMVAKTMVIAIPEQADGSGASGDSSEDAQDDDDED
jgi:uncharacterized RDD family membrane protein YckC